MVYIAAAAGPRAIALRIRLRRGSKDLAPAFSAPQTIGVVERVARFMAQDAHHPARIAALDRAHDAPLEPLEARMSKIKRHGNAGYAIGGEPFLAKPHVWPEADAATLKLGIQSAHVPLDRRALNRQPQVAQA